MFALKLDASPHAEHSPFAAMVPVKSGNVGTGLNAGAPRRFDWLNRNGQPAVSPANAGTIGNALVAVLRLAGIVWPGLLLYTPRNESTRARTKLRVKPPLMVASSGSPNKVRSQPLCTFGRHAAPTTGPRLLKSVL